MKDKLESVDDGRWNWYGADKEVTEIDYFNSFCTRMWLDYCDENNDPLSAPNRLDRDEYVNKWHDWLKERYEEKYGT